MTSPGKTVLCHYRYDPLDRLINHALPNIPERQRYYCKSRLATEIQGAMRFSIVQHGDQLLAQQRSEGNAPDTTLLVTDQQRSVLQTVKANHPPQPIAYSPYGHRPAENGLLSLLGFNGERPDPVTGCYLLGNGYRAFNPALMRFNSPDSLSPFGNGGINSYAYCGGDPRNRMDPSGHNWLIIFINKVNATPPIASAATNSYDIIKVTNALIKQIKKLPKTLQENPITLSSDNLADHIFQGAIEHKTMRITEINEQIKAIKLQPGSPTQATLLQTLESKLKHKINATRSIMEHYKSYPYSHDELLSTIDLSTISPITSSPRNTENPVLTATNIRKD